MPYLPRPKTATDFGVYESNYDISGYTRITKINGNVVENPGEAQTVSVLQPEITMTNITKDYTTADNMKVFTVADNQILLVRMTNHATVIVSQKSLSLATRQAIQKMLEDNGGKIPGDNGANAQWVMNFVYFSHEIQGDSFSYGGRTIYYVGNEVRIPHKSSSHEVRVDIAYTSTSAENSFTIENAYSDVPVELDIIKKEKDSDPAKYLPGAEFTITKLNETDGSIETEGDGETPVFQISQTTSSDEAAKGRLTFTGLNRGIYEIQETGVPAGYILDSDVTVYIRVEDGRVTWVEKGQGQGGTITWTPKDPGTSENGITFEAATTATADDPAGNATFTVPNTPGAELPSSGGPGPTWIYLIGSILLICCGTLLVARRRMWYKS